MNRAAGTVAPSRRHAGAHGRAGSPVGLYLGLFALGMGLLLAPGRALAGGVSIAQAFAGDDEAAAPAHGPWSAHEVAAREASRVALIDYRLRLSPDGNDAAILDTVLGFVQAWTPDDADLIRRRAQLAATLGDERRLLDATREIVRLDPKDQTAVLRLLALRVARLQTVEERIEQLRIIVEGGARVLDAPVRSRLALDASLLSREIGRDADADALLALAVRLDPTHKSAALLNAQIFAQRNPGNAPGLLDRTMAVMLADPLDPAVRFEVARQLAVGGAFRESLRHHRVGCRLLAADLGRVSDYRDLELKILEWYAPALGPDGRPSGEVDPTDSASVLRHGARLLLTDLVDRVRRGRFDAESILLATEKRGEPTSGLARPEEVRLSATQEEMRILSASTVDDIEQIREGLTDYAGTIGRVNELISNPAQRSAELTEDDLRRQLIALVGRAAVLSVLADVDPRPFVQVMRESGMGVRDPTLGSIITLVDAGVEGAIEHIMSLPERDDRAKLLLGSLHERAGRADEAVRWYLDAVRTAPLSPTGPWALARVERLTGGQTREIPGAGALARISRSAPAWLDAMASDALSFQLLRVDVDPGPIGATAPMKATVTITNTSPMALAVGPDRPINSTLMFSPALALGTEGRSLLAMPEAVDIGRRLRLASGESITATFHVDAGFLGWHAVNHADESTQARFRVIQGYRFAGTAMVPGAMCLSVETRSVLRRPLPMFERAAGSAREDRSRLVSAGDLIGRISEAEGEAFAETLAVARVLLMRSAIAEINSRRALEEGRTPLAQPPLTPEEQQGIVAACAGRFQRSGAHERALMLAMLPHRGMVERMGGFDEVVGSLLDERGDPLVWSLAMLTRASDPTNALLAEDRARPTGELDTLAARLRSRLADEGRTFSRANADERSLMNLTRIGG